MSDRPGPPYVVVTPVRDEEAHLEEVIRSVVAQTWQPLEWIIVDDGSTDRTPQILIEQAAAVPWMTVVTRPDRGFRASGAGVVQAVQVGVDSLRSNDWEFLAKLDGDLSLPSDYFEECLNRFAADPKLGIAGGTIESAYGEGGFRRERHPEFHVRGATKIYRRSTWEDIDGLVDVPGWDGIDEIEANRLGWRTRTFPDLVLRQMKPTGSAEGQWRDWRKGGAGAYQIGYHPLFVLARSFARATRPPYLIASAGLLTGYVQALLRRDPRAVGADTLAYVREQQMARLLGKETIWR